MFELLIRSGTSGYYDYDCCDMQIATIPSSNIPSVGDIIELGQKRYLVREVNRSYVDIANKSEFREFISVYVISA